MPVIDDKEFGKVTVRRSAKATQVKLRVAPNGTLKASLPMYAPLFLVKRLLNSSRDEIRELLDKSDANTSYEHGMQIGKSHTLIFKKSKELDISKHGRQIILSLPEDISKDDPRVIQKIREGVVSALRTEAKSYLPRRLSYLAEQYGYSYSRIRFSHASGRWGSCSSQGVISLNIALMKLPFELIDYVLIHELSHTIEMNHSDKFWRRVQDADPNYKKHRQLLKNETPSI